MGSNPYSVTITKTLVVDMIPHQQPALMGTATVEIHTDRSGSSSLGQSPPKGEPSGLMFDFSVEIHPDLSPKGEQLPDQSDVNIELKPNFDTTRYFVPDMVTELILTSIKTYYNTFLSTLK